MQTGERILLTDYEDGESIRIYNLAEFHAIAESMGRFA